MPLENANIGDRLSRRGRPTKLPREREAELMARLETVVADAGYDSEKKSRHRAAGDERAFGDPREDRPPVGDAAERRFRRLMKQRFARQADKSVYGQRSQSETVNSMMKRNLGEYLRSILTPRRKQEMLLRSIAHNLMLGQARRGGRD